MEEKVFQKLLQEKATAIDEILKAYLPKETGYQKKVLEAMNYSVLAWKTSSSHAGAGDVSYVWRKRGSRGAFYGSNRDDTYLFFGA